MDESIRSLRNAGSALKRFREQKDWTQKQLAEASNVQRARISEIENGEHNPTLKTYLNLLRSMGVELTAEGSISPEESPDKSDDSSLTIGGMDV